MSLLLIEKEIRRFLSSENVEVLCIKGKWGVGKTFAWKKYVTASASDGTISPKSYSYVSLFGINSLDALRFATFERTIPVSKVPSGPDLGTFDSLIEGSGRFGRKALPFVDAIFNRKGMSDALLGVAFLAVRNQLVCFDDLERAGKGLDIRDVLGLASFLKEERQCKVALLLNDEKLGEPDRAEFARQLEKVADSTIILDLSPGEAAAIALPADNQISKTLRTRTVALGITNIRVIKKIERMASRLSELLIDAEPTTVDQAHTAVVLGGWAVQQPDVAPSIDFIRRYSSFSSALRREAGQVDEDGERWRKVLSEYPYQETDEFDAVVLDGASMGYFDEVRLKESAAALEARRSKSADHAFSRVWEEMYHGSLATTDAEFLDALYSSSIADAGAITPLNINGAVSVLREQGRDEQADGVVAAYVEAHRADGPRFFDLSSHVFSRDDKIDDGLKEAFEAARASFVDDRDPLEVLRSIARERGWTREDVELLARQSSEDFERYFETLEGSDLRKAIDVLQTIGRSGDRLADGISATVTDALRRIGRKSPLRAQKIARFGVSAE